SIELKPENYFDYPKPKTTGTAVTFTNIEDNYILTLKSTSPAINITNTLTVYADSSQPTLTINPDHIRSGQDVTLESTNCPSGTKVIFKWKEKDGLRTEGSKTVTADSSGLAKHTIKDDKYTDASEDLTFTVTATCEKTGAISVPKTYKVNHHGYETSEITPPHPDPEQNFTITTYGLENDGQCYFVKIQNLETKEWLDPAEDRATLYDESCADGKMDSGKLVGLPGLPGTHRTINHKGQFYAIFESHEDFISFEIPGQLDGAYSYELWTPDKADTFGGANANEDDKHESGWLEFVVGDGQIPEEPKSPPPPCVEGIKYDFSGNGVIGEKTNLNPNIDLCTEYASSIGNIPTEATAFVGKFFAILLSISGGIILLLLIYSGYQIITSQGVPEKIKEARERITSAIVGLLFLVLSLVILQVIGVDLLKIPGLGK
ncbi:MAG: hypothetical protein HZC02_04935, partial [Candidatus Levybacteria bacterium]|nr:hypothetical protein [Candidatus Levybacteria bacterium]